MKKHMILAAAVALVLSACGGVGAPGGPNCTTGKRCGDSCISKSYTCHK